MTCADQKLAPNHKYETDSALNLHQMYQMTKCYNFKQLADNKRNLTQKLNLILGWVENILGKGDNAGNQHILFFPKYFQKPSTPRVVKTRDFVVKS